MGLGGLEGSSRVNGRRWDRGDFRVETDWRSVARYVVLRRLEGRNKLEGKS